MKVVVPLDIEKNVGFELENNLRDSVRAKALPYEVLDQYDFGQYIMEYLKILESPLITAGEHRKMDWENGWQENAEMFKQNANLTSLVPKYHSKFNIARLNNTIIRTFGKDFDFHLHSFFVDAILCKYIPTSERVFEFGCGTGYHLFRLSTSFPTVQFTGLDWSSSSQHLMKTVVEKLGFKNVSTANFDYYKPDYSVSVKDAVIFTVASLEQVGVRYEAFLKYLLAQKPSLCIHFEPIQEVLNPRNFLDSLTIRYFQKRKYLSGYLTTLRNLELENKAAILDVRRLNYGNKFIEGHTVIVWRPV